MLKRFINFYPAVRNKAGDNRQKVNKNIEIDEPVARHSRGSIVVIWTNNTTECQYFMCAVDELVQNSTSLDSRGLKHGKIIEK